MPRHVLRCGALVAAIFLCRAAGAEPISIVAAGDVYGDVTEQIGGANVSVTALSAGPANERRPQDPTALKAKALQSAEIVITSGAAYDTGVESLRDVVPTPTRHVIVVTSLVQSAAAPDSSFGMDPSALRALGIALSVNLSFTDPLHRNFYQKAEAAFGASLEPIDDKLAHMRSKYANESVVALDPTTTALAKLIGLSILDESLTRSPIRSPSETAAIISHIKEHSAKAVLYEAGTSTQDVLVLVQLARDQNIPLVSVPEYNSRDHYQDWMKESLARVDRALAGIRN